jgi:phasin family protein
MLNMSPEMIDGIKTNTDAFMAFSKIAMSSVEQLTTLNLQTARKSLEESTATAASILESKDALSSRATQALPLAASEGVAAYFRGVNDIANEACQETTKLMTTYLASAGPVSKHKAGWLQGFDVFNGLRQQLSAITETNTKAIADVTARVANQANAHSKKSA